MSEPKIDQYRSLNSLAKRIRKDLNGVHARQKSTRSKAVKAKKGHSFVLMFAHNGVGKTRLSMDFKNIGKKEDKRDTLYFNAFTEDLFDWDNDLENDEERKLKFKSNSRFFDGLEGMDIASHIRPHLENYADFDFDINYINSEIIFIREIIENGRSERKEGIKISRGEENIFIWCFFLAIVKLTLEAEKGEPYDWVKYVYIDDPISSLDEHNAITVASHLAQILRDGSEKVKVVISTHHGLFFNIMFNELQGKNTKGDSFKKKAYILHRPQGGITFSLRDTGETPFLHHMFALSELKKATKTGKVYRYHFNILRSVLEKTSTFFGSRHISTCFAGSEKKALYSRFIQIKNHAKYSIYEPDELSAKEKQMFKEVLNEFLSRYAFNIQV